MDDGSSGESPSKIPNLSVVQGGTERNLVRADLLSQELSSKLIPALQTQKKSLERYQSALGLKKDSSDIYRKRMVYPPPLTAEKAIKLAVDKVGGQYFIEARRSVERLEGLEEKAQRAFDTFGQETKGLRALSPGHYKKRQFLFKDLQQKRKLLNEALTRYNHRVDVLNRPENEAKIRSLAESLIKDDAKLQVRRLHVDRKLERISRTLRQAYKRERQFSELGKEKVHIKRLAVNLGEKRLSMPVPSNNKAFAQQLSKAREKTRSVGRILSK